MKLYHHAPKGSHILKTGLFSFSKSPQVDLGYYIYRSGKKTQAEISEWMEGFFPGYSRGIRCFTEPIQPTTKHLKSLVEATDVYKIDLDGLIRDKLLEAVYVKRPLSADDKIREKQVAEWEANHRDGFDPLSSPDEIDYSPINWDICDDKKGWRFAFTGFHLIILKDGVIPPKYLTLIGGKK